MITSSQIDRLAGNEEMSQFDDRKTAPEARIDDKWWMKNETSEFFDGEIIDWATSYVLLRTQSKIGKTNRGKSIFSAYLERLFL